MWEWMLAPIDLGRAHDVAPLVAWHGRVMTLAWGIMVPLGVLAARYFKVLPGQDWPRQLDNQVWWVTHRVMQYGAVALTLLGLFLILQDRQDHAGSTIHRLLGYTILVIAALQVTGGLLRGGKGGPTDRTGGASDHFEMTRRRIAFEVIHKALGYSALLLTVSTVVTGLWLANAPHWMWLAMAVWWSVLLTVAILLQRRGMALDTYQAIWGPDPELPGNRMTPIGIGIARRRG